MHAWSEALGAGAGAERAALLGLAAAVTLAALALGARALRRPVAAAPVEARARSPPKVVLLGAERAGKTNVFLRLAMGIAPDTATTQRVATASVARSDAAPALRLVDVPGHARLRAAALDELDDADALVFCLDASVASRGGSESATAAAALSTMKRTDLQDALLDSVDYLHDTLRTLAERRLAASNTRPPALLVLFTRADLSPVFADRRNLSDEKRRAQLLARCRRGLASALATRRASRGLQSGAAGRVTVEGIAEVADTRRSLVGRAADALAPVLRAVPFLRWAAPEDTRVAAELHPTRFGHNVRAGAGHQQESSVDYVVSTSRTDELLAQLHPRVVADGCAHWGLVSLDRSATWQPGGGEDHLGDLYAWLQTLAP